ncbi:Ribonuclease E inhibitor RraA/Dimethylmenaquinone methyltransferase [Penicillium camemberti]|uniref:Ribonuclease E inhibitor RraA/Dimethylmenaquinone methyltransferase n=1 Tax=Penicillium camemberti (strain FM 013) TaxID=1429867 RepID=A0A0G4PTF0_PENC3|nr:Ribonuclease E inhibitor RraA/Dimethylmenaquinone methyltransferase [Penicillium camemberti]
MATLNEQLAKLTENYSPCDVSDALVKLQKTPEGSTPRAGYLADLGKPPTPLYITSIIPLTYTHQIAAPATTFKFLAKDASPPSIATENPQKHGFPPGKHWVDYVGDFQSSDPSGAGSIVVIEQPENQYCAVTGGIMATRMKALGIKATVVGGRVRDLKELKATGLPIFARASSTVGTNAEAKAGARDVPISIGGVTVSPGDIIFCDPLEGVVAIPRELLGPVLELMPKLTAMDEQAKEAVAQGMSVTDAFKKFR